MNNKINCKITSPYTKVKDLIEEQIKRNEEEKE